MENSIKHGLAPKIDGGSITLRSKLLESKLHIEVQDDGVGMAATGTIPHEAQQVLVARDELVQGVDGGPVVDEVVGLHAVFVPHGDTWILEHEEVNSAPADQKLLIVGKFAELREHF